MFRYFEKSAMLTQGMQLALNSGADVNEADRACKAAVIVDGVPEPESWYKAWAGVGDVLRDQARADEGKNRYRSAANKYRRAAVYYALAERYVPHTDPLKAAAYKGVQDSFWRFVELLREPVERVEVPYEGGKALPALFIPAAGGGKAPTIVFVDGFDLYKEMIYLRKNSDAARTRGMNMLIVDTPGIGEALRLRNIPTRYDTEVPVKACIDYLEGRKDVDRDRIGLIGLSLGGYYGPRATAFEKRIKACVAWGAQWDVGARYRKKYRDDVAHKSNFSAPVSQLLWVTGTNDLESALEIMKRFTLDGVADKITVPFLVVHGNNDHLVPLAEAEATIKAAVNSPNAELIVTTPEYGGEGHCCMDNMQTGVDLIYDWLAEKLGGDVRGRP